MTMAGNMGSSVDYKDNHCHCLRNRKREGHTMNKSGQHRNTEQRYSVQDPHKDREKKVTSTRKHTAHKKLRTKKTRGYCVSPVSAKWDCCPVFYFL